MSNLFWHGWVKGYRWQIRLLEGLGVLGKKRYKAGSKCIEHCIVDDRTLARLIKYWWPPSHMKREFSVSFNVEDSFTLSDSNNNQVWGKERDKCLQRVYKMAERLPNVWPSSVIRVMNAWNNVQWNRDWVVDIRRPVDDTSFLSVDNRP